MATCATRSGSVYSPYVGAFESPIVSEPFDLSPLLRDALELDTDSFEELGAVPNISAISSSVQTQNSAYSILFQNGLELKVGGQSSTVKPMVHRHRNRATKRKLKVQEDGHGVRSGVIKKLIEKSSPATVSQNLEDLPASFGGYTGIQERKKRGTKVKYTIEKGLGCGLKFVPWNGDVPLPILDGLGRIVALPAGRPDSMYIDACKRAFEFMNLEGEAAVFSKDERNHLRGKFPVINFGVTHGNGTLEPINKANGYHHAMIERIRYNADFQRMAKFASATYAMWSPKPYGVYLKQLNKLFKERPNLVRIFDKCVFPCAALNFGPHVSTYKHRDSLNCPYGWCAIQSLGYYDSKTSAPLFLWEVGLAVEYPPWAMFFLPSAILTHSNGVLADNESRASFTLYCPGGLLRYVENGFRTEAEFLSEDPVGFEKMQWGKATRWKEKLELFTKYSDIVKEE